MLLDYMNPYPLLDHYISFLSKLVADYDFYSENLIFPIIYPYQLHSPNLIISEFFKITPWYLVFFLLTPSLFSNLRHLNLHWLLIFTAWAVLQEGQDTIFWEE